MRVEVVHNFRVPTCVFNGIDDGHGVSAVTVDKLVGAAFNLKNNDALVHGSAFHLKKMFTCGERGL